MQSKAGGIKLLKEQPVVEEVESGEGDGGTPPRNTGKNEVESDEEEEKRREKKKKKEQASSSSSTSSTSSKESSSSSSSPAKKRKLPAEKVAKSTSSSGKESSKSLTLSPAKKRKQAAERPKPSKEEKVATPGFDCSCVPPKSAAACKGNPRCNGRQNKYTHLHRRVILPPWLIASAILSFFQEFEDVLVCGEKVETRRVWSPTFFNSHRRALDEKLFVRVWCGRKGRHIGYCMYHSIREQKIGDMTVLNLVDEGRGSMPLDKWMTKYMKGCSLDTIVFVVRFTYIPLA